MTDQPEGGPGSATPMSERMQALLSRAVEDQASEQRQIQTLLADLRALLARLPGEVAGAVTDRPGDEAVSLAVVNAVQAGTDSLLARIEPIVARLDAMDARLADVAAGPDTSDVTDRVAAMDRRLDELAMALNDTHRRVIGLDNALGHVPEDLQGLGERIDSRVAARLDRLDEITALLTQLRDAGPDQELGADLAELSSAINELVARPSLAEDREGVVLAIRQLLGETVTETMTSSMTESAQQTRDYVDQALRTVTADSEARMLEHLDTAVVALAELIVRRRRRPRPEEPPAAAAPEGAEPDAWGPPVAGSPHPALDAVEDADLDVSVEEPPIGEPRPSGEGPRRRGWFRSGS